MPIGRHQVKLGELSATSYAQVIDMNDAQVTLVVDTPENIPAASGEVVLKSNTLLVDPNSSGTSEDLLLPAEADAPNVELFVLNTGGESIAVKEDGDSTTYALVPGGGFAVLYCDGAVWRALQAGDAAYGSGATVQNLSGNAETILTKGTGPYVEVDAGGSARTGTILEAGTKPGEYRILVNSGGENISFDTTPATANVEGTGTLGILAAGDDVMVYWSGSLWVPVGGSVLTS